VAEKPGGLFGVVADGMGFRGSVLVTAEIAVIMADGFSFGYAQPAGFAVYGIDVVGFDGAGFGGAAAGRRGFSCSVGPKELSGNDKHQPNGDHQ